jgi:hypothetical protein
MAFITICLRCGHPVHDGLCGHPANGAIIWTCPCRTVPPIEDETQEDA